jgi:hypothetical protein
VEAVRKLKANLKLQARPCGWCQDALKLGDDAAVCEACDCAHHSRCWDGRAGCSTAGCVNAPLRRLDTPATAAAASPLAAAVFSQPSLPSGYMACPMCGVAVLMASQVCPACKAITTPDGIYHGPKTNAPGAVAALVYGLIGLVFCQIILGPVAIAKASSAKKAMASDPTLGGYGLATAGFVLGIVDLVLFVLYVMVKVSEQ